MTDHLAALEELANGPLYQSLSSAQFSAILAAIALMRGQSEDMVLVPRTVTREMLIAWWSSDGGDPLESLLTDGDLAVLQRDWSAVIASIEKQEPAE